VRSSLQHIFHEQLVGCAYTANAQLGQGPGAVEVFTSEGGSSCPPAEAYVGEGAQRLNVLALMFHVDYWDALGWSDRLGLPESMKRQRTYTRSRRLSGTSLPAIDGCKSLVGNLRASIGRDLAATRSGASVKFPIRAGDRRSITAFNIVRSLQDYGPSAPAAPHIVLKADFIR
jgi:hypothetical protein